MSVFLFQVCKVQRSQRAFALPSSWLPQHFILARQKQDALREEALEFTKYQKTCDMETSWLKNSERHIQEGRVRRQVRDAVKSYETSIDEKRDRLRVMLETEDQQFLKLLEVTQETYVEKQAKIRERAKTLREKMERERQQVVSEKLEQLFREQCEELRHIQTKRTEEDLCLQRAAQMQTRRELQQQQQKEAQLFAKLWDADQHAKEERNQRQVQEQRQRNLEQLDFLRAQMEDSQKRHEQERHLKEEEALHLAKEREVQQLMDERVQHERLHAQRMRRRQLDLCSRLNNKQVDSERRKELDLERSILQQLQEGQADEQQEAAERKIALHEEQRRYQQYLVEELAKQKRQEEKVEQLFEENLRELWAEREKEHQLQQEARKLLMKDVMETRSLQIQHKLDLKKQKQDQLVQEREELHRTITELKLSDKEEKTRHIEMCKQYQEDLLAQMTARQQLQARDKAQAQREYQRGLLVEQQYKQRKHEVLSGSGPHTFRRSQRSRSAHTFHV
ncbi:cilia- and flagella-associated protein 53 [Thalassophryne amazonica]|uniref:cilia- and flagella-associated protein 53 n=1 Tax=Thalassophryne amazonica TaxID=390379 RepID=UPI00147177F9|nr:cilia- and flagella-associated protein 53 [Thalassophryne amazonica]